MRSRHASLLLSILLYACTGTPARVVTPGASKAPALEQPALVAASGAPASPAPGNAPALATPGPALAEAATLVGKVKAPASLISEHGGGIIGNNSGGLIGNNGGGLVGNNGGNYQLAATLEQVPVAQARVELLDAAGKAVPGPDGRPLSTLTAADGSFRFSAPLPRYNLVVRAMLGSTGSLSALAAPGKPEVDVELVSSLTTGYILERYVQPQTGQDPITILAKLPADVEAETRAKAAAALASGKVAPPKSLVSSELVATVESLRRGDSALDDQLETVRKLLIVAGQSDLGAGYPGTEVHLQDLERLLLGADGSLFMRTKQRVWRLTGEGRMATALDDDQLASVVDLAADDSGGLLVLQRDGGSNVLSVSRYAPGRVNGLGGVELRGQETAVGILAGKGDEVLVVTSKPELWSCAPGRSPLLVRALPTPATPLKAPLGRGADGTLYFSGEAGSQVRALAPDATAYAELDKQPVPLAEPGISRIDSYGRIFSTFGNQRVQVFDPPNGTARTLVEPLPEGLTGGFSLVLGASSPDGKLAYISSYQVSAILGGGAWKVFKLQDGQATHVAGRAAADGVGGLADGLALQSPSGVAAGPDGSVLLLDDNRVLHINADKLVKQVATFGNTGAEIPPARLRGDKAGNAYAFRKAIIRTDGVYKVGGDGTIARVYTCAAGEEVLDLAIKPDGSPALLMTRGGKPTLLLDSFAAPRAVPLERGTHVACNPAGAVYVADATHVDHVADGGQLTPIAAFGIDAGETFVVDAREIPYFTHGNQVERYDAINKTLKVIAGAGSPHFAGQGVDDGLGRVADLALDADGTLLILDKDNRQLKRIPAREL